MAATNLTLIAAGLKRVYPPREIFNLVGHARTFYSMVKHEDNFYGEDFKPINVQIGQSQGISRGFTNALTNKKGGTYKRFIVTRTQGYASHDLDGEAMIASQKDIGAYFRAKKREIDGLVESTTDDICRQFYGDGFGYLAQLPASSAVSGNVMTLRNPEDAVGFELNMTLMVAANNSGVPGTLRTGTMVVTKVDKVNGKITVDSIVSGTTTSDFIFRDGDYVTSGTRSRIVGLAGWLPLWTTSSMPGTLFSLDRDTYAEKLAGVPYDGTTSGQEGSKAEQLLRHEALIYNVSKRRPDTVFCNPSDYQDLVIEQLGRTQETSSSRQVRFGDGSSVTVTDKGIKVGNCTVYADAWCPKGHYYMLTMSSWEFSTMGGQAPHFIEDDGLFALRSTNADAIEVRMRYFGNLCCYAPGWNGHGKWTGAS